MEQLVQNIREQVRRSQQLLSLSPTGVSALERAASIHPAQELHSLDNELSVLGAEMERGEPTPPSLGVRSRIGVMLKRRLYRFLWWQNQQLKSLINLASRRAREESKLLETLSGAIREMQDVVLECRRQSSEQETRIRRLESAQLKIQANEIERNIRMSAVESQLSSISANIEQKLAEVKPVVEVADIEGRFAKETSSRERLERLVSELGIFTHQTRAAMSLQERRLSIFIEEARKRLPAPFACDQLQGIVDKHDNHKYDSVYAAFEDTFRGSREEIKERQRIYLPVLREHGVGSVQMPVLDLGCGRGEWIELLAEHGLTASGVDRDLEMVARCKERDLLAVPGEALAYLRSVPDASTGAVTSFHMVEHLPFDVTLAIIDEALRVLKPGGLIILETPNPENLLVATHAFNLDPTHQKPLPSLMLRFFVEARGFCDVNVSELHPESPAVLFPDDGRGVTNRLNHYFYGPRDYAVIGRKARG